MRVAVVTPTMKSGEKGGAEALYQGLVQSLRRTTGGTVDQVEVTIDESTFDAILRSYLTCYELDLRAYDLVISTKAPTFMVRHPNHVSYLLHTIRVFYDMFEREYGGGTSEQRAQRALIHTLDKQGLHPNRVQGHFTNGFTTYRRLQEIDPFWQRVNFRAVHHPPLLDGYKEPRPGEYILLPGRLHRWKRAHLVVEAYKHLDRDVPLKICGVGEDEPALRALAADDRRIQFLGKVSDEQLLDLYAGALAVPFVPLEEDYGLITIEAFRGKKPVITCHDSGDPTYFVKDFQTGFVVDPRPEAIAERLAYLIDHPAKAAHMGENGFAAAAHITWDAVVSALLAAGGATSPRSVVSGGREASADGPTRRGVPPSPARAASAATAGRPTKVTVLDMQPIDPPVGGGRIRLLGLYHALGANVPTTYVGTYDWPGPGYRRHRLSPTLEEIDVPLSDAHFAACTAWEQRVPGKPIIDVSFDLLAHHSPEFVETAREHAAASDVVVFSHPWVYPLIKDLLRPDLQLLVYDSQNVEGLLRATLLDDGGFGTKLVRHVAGLERELCLVADLVLACSSEDRRLFHELYGVPIEKIVVVPNGTFTSRVAPADSPARQAARRAMGLADTQIALFVGSAYQPNVEAAKFILEALAPALPDVTFVICGGVGEGLKQHPGASRDNVRITGFVDEEQKARYFAAADLAVNPMFSGSGTNIKMFDFMAAGLPIVSTPIGARGISTGSYDAFRVVEPADMPAATRQVFDDRDLAHNLGQAARRLADQKYSWERISAGLGRLLVRSARRPKSRRPFFSVLVPSYERPEHLRELMERLRAQTYRDFEVVVVDQSAAPWDGRDDYADIDLLYIHTDVKGAVKARNTAAFYARGEVLAFTDDDCRPLDDWLANGRRYFDDASVVGVEGLIVSEKRNDPNYRAVTNEGFEGIGFMTANLMVRRAVFLAEDGFDERFDNPHFREDTDFGWRASDHGPIPFGHDVRVYHPPHLRDTERESLAERNRFFEKDALLLAKHPDRYPNLFLMEGHYQHTEGFAVNFLRGARTYGIDVDDFYLSRLRAGVEVASAGNGARDN